MGETALELAVYWMVVRPGGILAGDDWAWPSVSHDLTHFAARANVPIRFFNDKLTWYLRKPRDYQDS